VTPEQAARGYIESFSEHDVGRALAHWARGGRQHVRGQIDTVAPDGVREQIEALIAAAPDFRFEVVGTVSEGERCALHWRLRGHFNGSARLYGVRPTGDRLELEGVDIFTVRDGLIVANDAFSDSMEFTRQIGMMPPRGSRRERFFTALFNLRPRRRRRRG